MVRNKQDRVQDPSDKVVDALAGGVTLVTTLVTARQPNSNESSKYSRNDPETGTEETSDESVGGVKSDLSSGESSLAEVATQSIRVALLSNKGRTIGTRRTRCGRLRKPRKR